MTSHQILFGVIKIMITRAVASTGKEEKIYRILVGKPIGPITKDQAVTSPRRLLNL
jgi:hypothetical protein